MESPPPIYPRAAPGDIARIARTPADITAAVLTEAERTPDPRLRTILTSAIRHLHAFVTESKLTEAEFRNLCNLIARCGQLTNASHNEVVLAAGSLGVSALVCMLDNGVGDEHQTTANLMGPFWRAGSPETPQGGSIVRSPTPGEPVFVTAWVRGRDGMPVPGVEVEVWQASGEGYYENQDPGQADMNLRGRFVTAADGRVRFRTVKPSGYPVPVNGPAGALIRAQGRHNLRPAHIHFLLHKPGYKTQFSQLYSSDDPNLESDVQFGVTRALVGRYVLHEDEPAPAPDVHGRWFSLEHTFVIVPGDDTLPPPPITAKTEGPRAPLEVLRRADRAG